MGFLQPWTVLPFCAIFEQNISLESILSTKNQRSPTKTKVYESFMNFDQPFKHIACDWQRFEGLLQSLSNMIMDNWLNWRSARHEPYVLFGES